MPFTNLEVSEEHGAAMDTEEDIGLDLISV
jgi:hypothetical protein